MSARMPGQFRFRNRRKSVAGVLVGLVAALTLAPGCKPPAPPPTPATTQPASVPALTTAADAAGAVLRALRSEQRAIAARDIGEVRRQRELLMKLAARDELLRWQRGRLGSVLSDDQIILETVSGWGGITGHYLERLNLDDPAWLLEPRGPDLTSVIIAARGDRERPTRIRLDCFRGRDGQWRVGRIDFVAPGAARTAAPQPAATQPHTP